MITLSLYFYFMIASFLVSCSVYWKLPSQYNYLKLFPPFLLATLVAEFLGAYLISLSRNTLIVYNIFSIIEFCFYLWVLSLFIRNRRMKLVIRVTIPIYVSISAINILLMQKMQSFNSVTFSVGCLLIVTFSIYYFLELFRIPKFVKLKNDPAFWICSSLLFFYCCGFPLFGFVNFWSEISERVLRNFEYLVDILNIFQYSLFTIAFLCIRTKKYSL